MAMHFPRLLNAPAAFITSLAAALFAAAALQGADLYVGNDCTDSPYSITNGKSESCDNAFIGYWLYQNHLNDDEFLMNGTLSSCADDNHVYVTGTGLDDTSTNWTIRGDLYVSYDANSCSLEISNGGSVMCGTAYIGRGVYWDYTQDPYFPSDNNRVTLTGLGATDTTTTWTNTGMIYVGYEWGRDNSLTVRSGADVTSAGGVIGQGYDIPEDQVTSGITIRSTDNTATVTGQGSTWNCGSGNLTIGSYGENNWLTISDGGAVTCANCIIGEMSKDNSNSVHITGKGSILTMTGSLTVGMDSNSGNRLTVTDGALVKVDGAISVNSGGIIYLGDGFIALKGDYTSAENETAVATLLGGIRIYNSATSSYDITATKSNTILTYICATTIDEAVVYAAIGYSDLDGYTIFSTTSVPEPAACAILGGFAALGLAIRHRQRR